MKLVVAGEANESVRSLDTPIIKMTGMSAAATAWPSPESLMRRCRFSLSKTVVLALMTTVLLPTSAGAADATVSWRVPGKFPVGLEVPVVVESDPGADGATFKLEAPGQRFIAAQKDSQTNRLRFVTSINETSVGKTVRFKLSRYDNEPVVRIENRPPPPSSL